MLSGARPPVGSGCRAADDEVDLARATARAAQPARPIDHSGIGAVARDLVSDIGGSLSVPAHFCGVFAHKPSLDLVPQRGAGPPPAPAVPVRGLRNL